MRKSLYGFTVVNCRYEVIEELRIDIDIQLSCGDCHFGAQAAQASATRISRISSPDVPCVSQPVFASQSKRINASIENNRLRLFFMISRILRKHQLFTSAVCVSLPGHLRLQRFASQGIGVLVSAGGNRRARG